MQNLDLQEIIKLLPNNVYAKDREGKYLFCNNNVANILKLDAVEDIIGKTEDDLLDPEIAEQIKQIDEQVMSSNKPYEAEEIGINIYGEKVVYATKKVPLHDQSGQVVGLLGISVNLSEKDLDIISLLPNNVYLKNRQGKFLMCNNNMVKIFGLKSSWETIGKTNFDLFDHTLAEQTTRIDEQVMKDNETYRGTEKGIDLSGKPATYFTTKIPLHDPFRKVKGLLGISVDITERIEHEKALVRAKKKTERTNQAKNEFLEQLGERFKTPLSEMYKLARQIRYKNRNKEIIKPIESLVNFSEKLMKDFDRITLLIDLDSDLHDDKSINNKIINKNNTNLKSVIAETFTEFKNNNQKDIEFVLDYDHRLTIQEKNNNHYINNEFKTKIKILISELLDNAVKFTEQGFIKLSVRKMGQKSIKISVQDTGMGCAKTMQATIDHYFRSKKLQKLYLGLAIIKKITQQLNGQFILDSTPDYGSIVTGILPLNLNI